MGISRVLLAGVLAVCVLSADPRTSQVYISPGPNSEVLILDAKTASITGSLLHGSALGGGVFNADGSRFYGATSWGARAFFVLDAATNTFLDWIPLDNVTTNDIAVSPDGTTAWIADLTSGSAIVLDLNSRQVVGSVPL